MAGIGSGKAFLLRHLAGLYPASPREGAYDLLAALALAAVAIPEQMATAKLAGVPASAGLVVFIAASIGFYLFGSNRFISTGADTTITPIFSATLATLGVVGSQHYVALTALLSLLVGLMVTSSGILRMGWIARLLSVPIITGFLAGISIHILVSQMPALLGISNFHSEFFPLLADIADNIAAPNSYTIVIGLAVFAVIFCCEKVDPRIPGAMISLILATASVWLFGLAARGVAVLGNIQAVDINSSLPPFTIPDIEKLLPIALIISLVIIIQTATTSRSFPSHNDAENLNRDIVGVGFANILSGLVGGFPANSSPPRTAIVCESGGRSRLAGFSAAMFLALFLAFGLSLLSDVPQAALAGILLFVAQRIFRWNTMKLIARQSRAEFGLLLATAFAIVITPIETGVGIGIGLSLLHGVWTVIQARAVEFQKVPGSTVWWPESRDSSGEKISGIVVVGFQAPLFFLNADAFRRSVDAIVGRGPQPVHAIILEASSLVELDFSGAQALIALIGFWKDRGVDFYVSRLESVRAQMAFERFGIRALLGEQRIFRSVDEAIKQGITPWIEKT